MTRHTCIRFLRTDLQQELLRELTARSLPHQAQPDGAICADGPHADALDAIVEQIIEREIPDWVMHWVPEADRPAWRDDAARNGVPFIEYEHDGDPHFMVPRT